MHINDNIKSGKYKSKETNRYHPDYVKAGKEAMDLFWNDCAESEYISNHPKRKLVEEMAWEHGHHDGLQSVYYWYTEFVRLLK